MNFERRRLPLRSLAWSFTEAVAWLKTFRLLELLDDPSFSDDWFLNCSFVRDDPSRHDHFASFSHLPTDHFEFLHIRTCVRRIRRGGPHSSACFHSWRRHSLFSFCFHGFVLPIGRLQCSRRIRIWIPSFVSLAITRDLTTAPIRFGEERQDPSGRLFASTEA